MKRIDDSRLKMPRCFLQSSILNLQSRSQQTSGFPKLVFSIYTTPNLFPEINMYRCIASQYINTSNMLLLILFMFLSKDISSFLKEIVCMGEPSMYNIFTCWAPKRLYITGSLYIYIYICSF